MECASNFTYVKRKAPLMKSPLEQNDFLSEDPYAESQADTERNIP